MLQLYILAKFLIIDTALEEAVVALSLDNKILAEYSNKESPTHAGFIQVAIANLFDGQQMEMNEIDAIAVTLGPGSYTGLRVGLASAKGIAFALQKPLIGLSTLRALCYAAIKKVPIGFKEPYQIFTMIDARRMEIFGAIYDAACEPLLHEQAIILDSVQWNNLISQPTICIGSGTTKTKDFIAPSLVAYQEGSYTSQELLEMALIKFMDSDFENLAYVGPNYLKEVYILPSK